MQFKWMWLLLWVALAAVARPGFATINDSSVATAASDAVEYRTALTLSHEQSALRATTTLQIPQQYLSDGTVALFLNQDFSVESVQGPQVVGFEIQPSSRVPIWNEIIIEFEAPTNSAEALVQIAYSGVIDNQAEHGNFITANQVHLSIDSSWHPIFNDFSTPLIGTVQVEFGESWEVFAPGKIISDGDKYQIQSTTPTLDVSLYAHKAPNKVHQQGFTVVYDASNADKAEFVLSAGLQCLQRLNQRFGGQAPLAAAQTILLKRPGPSFARGNYISLNAQSLGSQVHTQQYLCHEIAHNWTTFPSAMSHDYWMIESFAEFISASEIAHIYGDDEFNTIVSQWQQQAQGEAWVWRQDTDRRASHKVNYGLGPIALMKLEQKLGTQAFDQLVTWYMTHNVTETEELLARLTVIAGPETAHWFQALLAGEAP